MNDSIIGAAIRFSRHTDEGRQSMTLQLPGQEETYAGGSGGRAFNGSRYASPQHEGATNGARKSR